MLKIIDVVVISLYPVWLFLFLTFFLIKYLFRPQFVKTDSNYRLAIISSSMPPEITGGVASAHYNLFLMLKKQGVDVKLFSTKYIATNQTDSVLECIEPDNERLKWLRYKLWYWHHTVAVKILKQKNSQIADIVNTSIGALKLNKLLIRYMPQTIITYDHGLPILFLSNKIKSKIIVIEHHNPSRFYKMGDINNNNFVDTKIATWLEKQVYKKIDTLVFPSKYIQDYTINTHAYTGIYAQIYNLLNFEYIDAIQAKEIDGKYDHAIYLPSVGSYLKGKAYTIPVINRICNLMPKHNLMFYLSGSIDKQFLKTLINSIPVNCNIFTPGQVTYETNIGYVKSCNIAISPTIVENFSMALLEANYIGLPVIAFNIGGNNELVKNSVNGYIVNSFNIDEMASNACKFLEKTFLENSLKCREIVTRNFNEEIIYNDYLNIIKS